MEGCCESGKTEWDHGEDLQEPPWKTGGGIRKVLSLTHLGKRKEEMTKPRTWGQDCLMNKKANCVECSWWITEDGEIAMLSFGWTQFWGEQFERDERRKLIYIWQMCTRLQVKYINISKVNLYTMHYNFRISKRKSVGIYNLMYGYFVKLFSDCVDVGTPWQQLRYQSSIKWLCPSPTVKGIVVSTPACHGWPWFSC